YSCSFLSFISRLCSNLSCQLMVKCLEWINIIHTSSKTNCFHVYLIRSEFTRVTFINFLLNVLTRFLLKAYFCLSKVEYHPFQRPRELVDYCRSRGIVFEGYCPLAKGEALTHPSVVQLVKKYGRTPAQICIRWSIQNGIVTIPKSTRPERIQENCKVRFGYTLKSS
uniref:NADP-dependent oxidoreductase domain-containing protein n=1 Tax=Coturnix japonica TaxID=93934 RepID=A0A8C2UEX8_COTJA